MIKEKDRIVGEGSDISMGGGEPSTDPAAITGKSPGTGHLRTREKCP